MYLVLQSLVTSVSRAVEEIGGEIASFDKENRSQVVVTALEDTSETSCEFNESQHKSSDEISSNKAIVIDQYAGNRSKAPDSDSSKREKQGIIFLNASDYGRP